MPAGLQMRPRGRRVALSNPMSPRAPPMQIREPSVDPTDGMSPLPPLSDMLDSPRAGPASALSPELQLWF